MHENFNAIKLNEKDNVAVALKNIKSGEAISIQGLKINNIKVLKDIPYGHKVAISYIDHNKEIIKYGECMGISTEEILPGTHVHISNVRGLTNEERFAAIDKFMINASNN